jgi:hypothetical protein
MMIATPKHPLFALESRAVKSDAIDGGIGESLFFEPHHDYDVPRPAIPDWTRDLPNGEVVIIS